MSPDIPLVVVSGGPGPEAEVSRASGAQVAAALRARFPRVRELELTPDLARQLAPGELVFPALHGPPGEDGSFQGFCEVLGLAYVGSGVAASALAMDKPRAKACFRAAGLPVAPDLVLVAGDPLPEAALAALGERLILKPRGQGSALGVQRVRSRGELPRSLERAFAPGEEALVEPWIEGREVTCGVLESDAGPAALPVCEVRTPGASWYDYEHRYTPGLSEHRIPAGLPGGGDARVQELALAAHRALGCRDLSRADFVVPEEGDPVLLEVNTLPGMTATSLFPDEARAAGIEFEELCARLVLRAATRR